MLLMILVDVHEKAPMACVIGKAAHLILGGTAGRQDSKRVDKLALTDIAGESWYAKSAYLILGGKVGWHHREVGFQNLGPSRDQSIPPGPEVIPRLIAVLIGEADHHIALLHQRSGSCEGGVGLKQAQHSLHSAEQLTLAHPFCYPLPFVLYSQLRLPSS